MKIQHTLLELKEGHTPDCSRCRPHKFLIKTIYGSSVFVHTSFQVLKSNSVSGLQKTVHNWTHGDPAPECVTLNYKIYKALKPTIV